MMDSNYKWLEWAKRIQSIAQIGLTYSKDKFDQQRYNQLRDISIDILNQYISLGEENVRNLFAGETGYQTPKVDVRAAVFKEDKILLVQEGPDMKWCMPGGWVDIDLSLKQAAVKEVREEAGVDCEPKRIISVFDRRLNATGPISHTIFTVFIQCEYLSGQFEENLETVDARFFPPNEIPELSENKTNLNQIRQCFEAKDVVLHEPTFE